MFHEITIVGNLGNDPEMRFLPDGTPVCNFSMASNRKWKNQDGSPGEETTWFRISAWGKTAENCNQYLHKGSLVLVEGRLVCDPETGGPRLYTRQDGSPGTSFEVSANTVRFLSGREGESEPENAGEGAAATPHDDIPF